MKRWPSARQLWFQLHWFVGITAGTLLVVIGLSGAVLSFREEIVDAVTPGGRQVAVSGVPLGAPALAEAVAARAGPRPIATLTLFAEPGHAARVTFAPPAGQRRGQTVWVDPSTGEALPPLRADPFMEWVESLHRWLLLPREDGRVVTGVLAAALLLLSASGLYLRWPRRPLDWRAWLTFDTGARGRSFWWGLHSVAGTLALVVYLMFTATGLYWAFDWIRDPIDRVAGDPRPPRQPARPMGAEARARPAGPPADIAPAWAAFQRIAGAAGGWTEVVVRLPAPGARQLLFTWRGPDAAHERARNRTTVTLDGATVVEDDRHAARPAGRQALTVIYPLHMGTYFGLAGRIVNLLASLMLPLFAVTGWLLYLDRRRKQREIRRQQAALAAATPGEPAGRGGTGGAVAADRPVTVAFASQSGTAQGIALRTAALLRSAGVPVAVLPFATLDAERLRGIDRLLLVAATFGEGEAPDDARGAARALARLPAPALQHLRYGLLALGDRHYPKFCGFGHALDHALESAGAGRLFPMIEVDDQDPVALDHWRLAVGSLAGAAAVADAAAFLGGAAEPLRPWTLAGRECVNPGSLGAPLYRIDLAPPAGALPHWRAGALIELSPGAPDALPPAALRRYSVASLPDEGRLRLFVRQVRHAGGLGLASGWLTAGAPLGTGVQLRLLDNPAFAPCEDDCPAVFIGNGSGWAGLRGHLLARIAAGRPRNWLLFGERQQAHDDFCAGEVDAWQAAGHLAVVDRVFSRDGSPSPYVQHRLRERADLLRQWLDDGACLYVCGSLRGMAAGVDAALVDILGPAALDDLIAAGRYRRDVY
ncbi:nitric oxide synthase [Xylophilus sp. Kf1]|nr:nitric oxide synthase [Xylophilus sp. Kf1]